MSGIAGIVLIEPLSDAESAICRMSKALQHRGNELLHRTLYGKNSSSRALISVRAYEQNAALIDSTQDHLLVVDSFPLFDEREGRDPFQNPDVFNTISLRIDASGLRIRRSLDGTRGLYYVRLDHGIAFASEKKCIWAIAQEKSGILDPGDVLSFTWEGRLDITHLRGLQMPAIDRAVERFTAIEELQKTLNASFRNLKRANKCAVLFSGGVDSALAALLTKMNCRDTLLVTAACKGSHDEEAAVKSAELMATKSIVVEVDAASLWEALPEVIHSIETSNRMQVEIALPLFFAAREAKRRGYNMMVSGQGPDELFAGYERHEILMKKEGDSAVERTLWNEVSITHETNIQRDARAIAAAGVDVFFPYLYPPFVRTAMSLPASLKVNPLVTPSRKIIFRELAENLGLPHDIAVKRKRAAQFSSGAAKLLSTSIIQRLEASVKLNKREASNVVQRVLDTIAMRLGIPNVTNKSDLEVDLEPTRRLQQRLGISTAPD